MIGDRIAGDRRTIVLDGIFRESIDDLDLFPVIVSAILRYILKSPFPVILCRHSLAGDFRAIRQQTHCDAGRTFASDIILVIPDFLTGDIGSS